VVTSSARRNATVDSVGIGFMLGGAQK
jgi:hypothetical protein